MKRIGIVLVFVTGAFLGVAATAGALRGGPRTTQEARRSADRIGDSRRSSIVLAAQQVSPAVVSVSVTSTRIVRQDPFGLPLGDDFFSPFMPRRTYRERVPSLGSGVIVDKSGIVITNSHVIRDAEDIRVNLSDGRHFVAKVLGESPAYDVAVLQLDAAKDLPLARLGNSDSLVVGEWAIAIGNPFGFLIEDSQPTVTAGVISATRRDIKAQATESGVYKNMIQTDAAINPGNSGGPLVNGDGEVIGINTFIFSSGGGSIGLGFAIPINLVQRLVGEIRLHGKVRVAWPGMQVQQPTEAIAQRLGWREMGGLVVTVVDARGPAARAGVRSGDRIRRVNGRTTDTVEDAQASIYGSQVGDLLHLDLERDGKRMSLDVKLEEAPEH